VVPTHVPPLRGRREDIPMLVQHFYERIVGAGAVAPAALVASLVNRGWPGNVRELRNAVERGVSLGWPEPSSAAPSTELPSGLASLVPVHLDLKGARRAWMEQFENVYVRAMLEKTGGNVSRAAEAAGVSRRFLQRTIVRLRIRSATLEEDVEGDDEA
jgi:DNA-binding NtrC family response regulator